MKRRYNYATYFLIAMSLIVYIVLGLVDINNLNTKILFWPGAKHSFYQAHDKNLHSVHITSITQSKS